MVPLKRQCLQETKGYLAYLDFHALTIQGPGAIVGVCRWLWEAGSPMAWISAVPEGPHGCSLGLLSCITWLSFIKK